MKKYLVLLCLCVVTGCGKVNMAPDAEQEFRGLNARVQAMAEKAEAVDPNTVPTELKPFVAGWPVFADGLQPFVDMMDNVAPEGGEQ